MFTAGVDLSELIQHWATGSNAIEPPAGGVDPLDLFGRTRTKPVVAAVHGLCYMVGIELLLACDIRVAASDNRFGQVGILRGIYPVGGETLRFACEAGWAQIGPHLANECPDDRRNSTGHRDTKKPAKLDSAGLLD